MKRVETAIAEREFKLTNGKAVLLELLTPTPDGDDWSCRYRITFHDRIREGHAFGVDRIQAILLAMTIAQAELSNAPETQEEGLTWLGELDLGLPISPQP